MLTKLLSGGLFALLLSTQYALFFGNKNVFVLQELQAQVIQVEQDINKLSSNNQHLVVEVIGLKQQGKLIEALARSHLGYIKDGETFFQIIE